jgi:hypothetical protein
LQNRFVQTQNPGAQLILSVDWLAAVYISVYHARGIAPFSVPTCREHIRDL